MRRLKTGRPALVLAWAVMLLLACAPAAVANIAPTVSDGSVTPSSLPYAGGMVTVSATVTDIEGGGVDFVWVDVTSLGGWTSYALSRGASNPDEWVGDIELPPNLSGQPVTYQFTVVARDLDNEEGRGAAGTVEVAGGPLYDEAPALSDPAVSPRALPRAGGPVQLAVTATDATGLTEVYAYIVAVDGTVTRVPLAGVGGDRYAGVWNVPAVTRGPSAQYAVRMVAVDAIHQVGDLDAGTITVGPGQGPARRGRG